MQAKLVHIFKLAIAFTSKEMYHCLSQKLFSKGIYIYKYTV